ncbi:MAG: signal peptidase II [Candidatus Magasanikbacteria bacterium]|jgi:signal peptidase II|nr:signal peptidase II [Candidatus Magasanikbacteria bacterium]MBT4315009.1 signal peptidase II [Candidatus Magasanikbacteria bacterium]MBT4547024.1 signal peptidase II [Candidatus Magasanikbacteria bacterium]MBT6819366.1 signal peptidase II [Candidatus Magasanikbacteria bacterium]
MKNKIRLTIYIFVSGFFLFLDQVLKYFARSNSEFSFYVWKNWLGWEYFENAGIAFSIPFPGWLVVLLTPIVLLLVFVWIGKMKNKNHWVYLATFLIFSGAISNFIDRILFGFTIDYLRLFTGVINIADVVIVVGAGILVLGELRRREGG